MRRTETEISSYKENILKLSEEKEKLTQDKESLEEQLNQQLSNMYRSYDGPIRKNFIEEKDEQEEKRRKR